MPNDCSNHITILGNEAQISLILANDFKNIPRYAYEKIQCGKEMLEFVLRTGWGPPTDFLDMLKDKYDGLWVLNRWKEEGGCAGVIILRNKQYEKMEWVSGCIEEIFHRLRDSETMPDPVFAEGT